MKSFQIILGLLIAFTSQLATASTFTSKTGTSLNWSSASSWVNGSVPGASDDVIINGSVILNGNYTVGSLTVSTGKSLTINSGYTLTVNYTSWATAVYNLGTISFQSGGNNKISIQCNNWITSAFNNSGTFSAGTGTVEFKGSSNALSVSGTFAFYNVTVDGLQSLDFGSNSTFTGSVLFKNASQMAANGTLVFNNTVTCQDVTAMKFSGTNTTINGTLRLNNSTVTDGYPAYGSNGTLEINTTTTINGNDYDWPTGSGSTVPANVSIVGGNLQLQSGSRYIKKTLTVASGATLNANGACFVIPSTFTSITNNGTLSLGGIDVLSGATWNVNANYTIATLQIENGGTVNANAYTLTMNAAINNCNNVNGIMEVKTGGTFNPGTSVVTFIPPYYMAVNGTVTFNNLAVQGSNTINIPSAGSVTVSGNLNIASTSTVNNPGYINYTQTSSVTTNGSQTGVTVPSSVPTVVPASGNSGGGSVNADRWSVLSPNTYTLTSDLVLSGSNKIVTIQSGSEMVIGNNTVTCDSVYLYGKVTINNTNGLSNVFGNAKIVIASDATVSYNATSGTQTITPRTDYAHLQLSGAAAKTFAAGTYAVSGDFTVSGATPTFATGSTVNFNGTTQSIAGAPFKDVTFSNSGTKTLTSQANVTGVVNVTGSAVVASGGNLVLVSTASGTASVGSLTGSANITGNVVAQRFIPSNGRKWRFLSSPVANATFSNSWQQQMPITGPGTGGSLGTTNSNGFDWTATNAPSIYSYSETLSGNMNNRWASIANTSTTIATGKGYRVFVRGDRSQGTILLNGSNYTANDVTLSATSTLNKGQVNVALSCSNGCTANDGWNLVGNPYPSAIDWNNSAWVSARSGNISSTIYIFNPYNNQWASWNSVAGPVNQGSNIIGSGQAFFVKTTGSATLSFQESYKSTNLSTGLFGKTSGNEYMNNLHVTLNDTAMLDETVIYFNDNATKNVEEPYDGVKPGVTGNSVSSYTSDNKSTYLMFNGIPTPSENATDSVFLFTALYSVNASFTLNLTGLSTFSINHHVYLYDRYNSSLIAVNTDTEYGFSTIATDAASYDPNRFVIIFKNGSALPVTLTSFNAVKTSAGKVKLHWSTSSEVNSDHFVVEKSTDALNFTQLDVVRSAGNSTSVNEYNYIDENPVSSINYYRLKQVDADGKYSYSAVVSVNFNTTVQTSIVNVFPVPARDVLNLSFKNNMSQNVSVEVMDLFGKSLISTQLVTDKQNAASAVDISSLSEGVYFLALSFSDGSAEKIKFIKQ